MSEWTAVSPPLPGGDRGHGPGGGRLPDRRTPECKHGHDSAWGVKGERQRRCRHCKLWIWDHSWPNTETTT